MTDEKKDPKDVLGEADKNAGGMSAQGAALNPPETKKDELGPIVKPKKEEMVEIPKAQLSKLLDRLDALEDQTKILTQAADVGRMTRLQDARNKGKLVRMAKISMIDEKYVIGWSRIKDDVYFDEQGKLHEEQTVKIYYEDKSTQDMTDRTFARIAKKIECEVVKESTDSDGNKEFELLLPDGKKITIDIKFIN